ncbi:MAG: hypothetical protein IJ689_04815 [Alphaproteobacteria bacterium]|nr:hypothetical protein [Alphaproteobacteria bacterium]
MLKRLIFAIWLLFPVAAQAQESSFLYTVLDTVASHHITPIDIKTFLVEGLKESLNEADKNLVLGDGKDMVYLYYKGKQIGLWHKPQDENDIKKWAEIGSEIIAKAAKTPSLVGDKGNILPEKTLYYAVDKLNDHSHYYFGNEALINRGENLFTARTEDETAYIKIKGFSSSTAEQLKQTLQKNSDIKALIIDLRGNPGGMFAEAIEVAKIFIDEGIIVAAKGKKDESTKYYVANNPNTFNKDIAVLIDKDTASSAEALAAALKEQVSAKLIGTQSFGKGSIQDVYVFDNSSRLVLTTGEFFTPSGAKIEKVGLIPDYCIISNKDKTDTPCPPQSREDESFDIDFAKKILLSQP